MAILQIRDLPDPLHQILQLRARRKRRSLSQQPLSVLQQSCSGLLLGQHRQALIELAVLAQEEGIQPFDPSPEDLNPPLSIILR